MHIPKISMMLRQRKTCNWYVCRHMSRIVQASKVIRFNLPMKYQNCWVNKYGLIFSVLVLNNPAEIYIVNFTMSTHFQVSALFIQCTSFPRITFLDLHWGRFRGTVEYGTYKLLSKIACHLWICICMHIHKIYFNVTRAFWNSWHIHLKNN